MFNSKEIEISNRVYNSTSTEINCCVVKCTYSCFRMYDMLKHLNKKDKMHTNYRLKNKNYEDIQKAFSLEHDGIKLPKKKSKPKLLIKLKESIDNARTTKSTNKIEQIIANVRLRPDPYYQNVSSMRYNKDEIKNYKQLEEIDYEEEVFKKEVVLTEKVTETPVSNAKETLILTGDVEYDAKIKEIRRKLNPKKYKLLYG